MQEYSDPKRANDPYALPDLEVWEDIIHKIKCTCGSYDIPESFSASDFLVCPSCKSDEVRTKETGRTGWFYQFCSPGCLPDSDFYGPFETHKAALEDALSDTAMVDF